MSVLKKCLICYCWLIKGSSLLCMCFVEFKTSKCLRYATAVTHESLTLIAFAEKRIKGSNTPLLTLKQFLTRLWQQYLSPLALSFPPPSNYSRKVGTKLLELFCFFVYFVSCVSLCSDSCYVYFAMCLVCHGRLLCIF